MTDCDTGSNVVRVYSWKEIFVECISKRDKETWIYKTYKLYIRLYIICVYICVYGEVYKIFINENTDDELNPPLCPCNILMINHVQFDLVLFVILQLCFNASRESSYTCHT